MASIIADITAKRESTVNDLPPRLGRFRVVNNAAQAAATIRDKAAPAKTRGRSSKIRGRKRSYPAQLSAD